MGLPRSCSCGAIHPHGVRCPVAVKRHDRTRGNATKRYGSNWAAISKAVIERDGGECQLRLPGCTIVATTADHIIRRRDGGSNDMANLRAACRHCNSARG